ncbi:MAG TPA: hypothetical protein VLJ68_12105 [Chitinophagaceae bacterium]|nr:hypothetical protein [Chitinophagaceae bacterium]
MGILWLAVCLLFLAAGVGYLLELDWWHYCGISAIVLSQVLIITDWKEARWGTLINIVLLSVIIWDMVG